jgi:hypothetical protein
MEIERFRIKDGPAPDNDLNPSASYIQVVVIRGAPGPPLTPWVP